MSESGCSESLLRPVFLSLFGPVWKAEASSRRGLGAPPHFTRCALGAGPSSLSVLGTQRPLKLSTNDLPFLRRALVTAASGVCTGALLLVTFSGWGGDGRLLAPFWEEARSQSNLFCAQRVLLGPWQAALPRLLCPGGRQQEPVFPKAPFPGLFPLPG